MRPQSYSIPLKKKSELDNGQDWVSQFSMGVNLCRPAIPEPREATGGTTGERKAVVKLSAKKIM